MRGAGLAFIAAFTLCATQAARGDLVGVDPVAEEAAQAIIGAPDELTDLVTESIRAGSPGASAFFTDRSPERLSLQQVDDLAALRNIDVRIARLVARQSEQAFIAEDADFDVILNYFAAVDATRNYERTETFVREHEQVTDFEQLEQDFAVLSSGGIPAGTPEPCVIVDGRVINDTASGANPACDALTEVTPIKDFASFESATTTIWDFGASATKAFQWGASVNASLTTEYKKRLTTSLGFFDLPLGDNNPLGTGSRYAWASTLVLAAGVPLPYAKQFGEYGNRASVEIKLADQARIQAEWQYAVEVNDARRDAKRAYWVVVDSLLTLRTRIRHRESLDELHASAKRLFDQRQITEYAFLESQVELENARNFEETAWGEYLKASNALVELLDLGRDLYVVPAGYANDLQESYEVDVERALEAAYELRPELKRDDSLVESSNIGFRFGKVQTRPDLTLQVSYALRQDNGILGYRDFFHSVENIFRPDKDDFFIGLSYRYPFGNVAVKKQLSQARIARTQSLDNRELTRVGITEDVNSAAAAVLSAETQVRLTKTNLKLADLAYERGQRLRQNGLITEFELLSVFDALLDARVDHIRAVTQYQSNYAQLEWAQGLLAQTYGAGAE